MPPELMTVPTPTKIRLLQVGVGIRICRRGYLLLQKMMRRRLAMIEIHAKTLRPCTLNGLIHPLALGLVQGL